MDYINILPFSGFHTPKGEKSAHRAAGSPATRL